MPTIDRDFAKAEIKKVLFSVFGECVDEFILFPNDASHEIPLSVFFVEFLKPKFGGHFAVGVLFKDRIAVRFLDNYRTARIEQNNYCILFETIRTLEYIENSFENLLTSRFLGVKVEKA